MTYKTAIIGLGSIGYTYDNNKSTKTIKSHFKAIYYNKKYKLLFAIEKNIKIKNLFEKSTKIKCYKDLSDIHKNYNLDLLIISVPTNNHFKIFKESLKRILPKVILIEKPSSYKSIEIKKMIKLCLQYNIKIFVNYIRRADPSVVKIKKLITTYHKKDVFNVNVFFTKGIVHNGSHFFDLIRLFFGEVKSCQVIKKRNISNNEDAKGIFVFLLDKANVNFFSVNTNNQFTNSFIIENKYIKILYRNSGLNVVYILNNKPSKIYIVKNNLLFYQKNILNEISKFFNKSSNVNLCSCDEDFLNIKYLEKIVNKK